MSISIRQIAIAFSSGQFDQTYSYLAPGAEWNIVGDKILQGKEEIIAFCDQTAKYFSEVTTDFRTHNIIVSDNRVAINGTAEFTNKAGKKTYVSSCDVYEFNDGLLTGITSYCITTGKE